MLVSIIAAMDRRGLIGNATGLPWHLPGDLKRFKHYTLGKPIIMGRTTFELIGRPLPGRFNIVLTHDQSYNAPGCQVVASSQDALTCAAAWLARQGGEETFVIGGAQVYQEVAPVCARFYLTIVEGAFAGTVHFPLQLFDRQTWLPVYQETAASDEKNPYRHSFYILERRRPESLANLDMKEPAGMTVAALLVS